jgi:diazepam-binding inhibitor (GABA receptor modulating acyl-CoA-binding protein)
MFDMTGKAKWQAWMDIKGKSKEAAEQEYMDVCLGFSDISFGGQCLIALHGHEAYR